MKTLNKYYYYFCALMISSFSILLFSIISINSAQAEETHQIYSFDRAIASRNITNGSLVRFDCPNNSDNVYVIQVSDTNVYKRYLHRRIIRDLNISQRDITNLSCRNFNNYRNSRLGIEIDSNGRIVTGDIYVLESRPRQDYALKRHLNITSDEFNMARFEWGAVFPITRREFNNPYYRHASPIESSSIGIADRYERNEKALRNVPTVQYVPPAESERTKYNDFQFQIVIVSEGEPNPLDNIIIPRPRKTPDAQEPQENTGTTSDEETSANQGEGENQQGRQSPEEDDEEDENQSSNAISTSNPEQENENDTSSSTGAFYTSSHHRALYYYPEECRESWERLSERYRRRFDSLNDLLGEYNDRILSPECEK